MTELIFVLLAFLVSFFVIYPIVRSRMSGGLLQKGSTNHRASELEERKEAIYSAIKDIDFDYQMGKLSEEDYKELRQQYKDEAVHLLKKIDRIQRRDVKSKGIFAQGQKQKATGSKNLKFCWICGTAITKTDQFCSNCGNKLA